MPDPYRETIQFYDNEARDRADRYDLLDRVPLFKKLEDFLSPAVSRVLDVGAGHGIDARRFSREGRQVVAVEPSVGLRNLGRHRSTYPNIEWVDDSLPDLACLKGREKQFDLVLLNRVFMHVPPFHQESAYRRLLDFVASDGAVYMIVREGPSFDSRHMYPVDYKKLADISDLRGFSFWASDLQSDAYGRPEVGWRYLFIRQKA